MGLGSREETKGKRLLVQVKKIKHPSQETADERWHSQRSRNHIRYEQVHPQEKWCRRAYTVKRCSGKYSAVQVIKQEQKPSLLKVKNGEGGIPSTRTKTKGKWNLISKVLCSFGRNARNDWEFLQIKNFYWHHQAPPQLLWLHNFFAIKQIPYVHFYNRITIYPLQIVQAASGGGEKAVRHNSHEITRKVSAYSATCGWSFTSTWPHNSSLLGSTFPN